MEYNASARAKQILPQLGIVSEGQMPMIREVLAAALTYVAATLSAVMQVLCFVLRLFAGSQQRRR